VYNVNVAKIIIKAPA